jgi:hypothetical protein
VLIADLQQAVLEDRLGQGDVIALVFQELSQRARALSIERVLHRGDVGQASESGLAQRPDEVLVAEVAGQVSKRAGWGGDRDVVVHGEIGGHQSPAVHRDSPGYSCARARSPPAAGARGR